MFVRVTDNQNEDLDSVEGESITKEQFDILGRQGKFETAGSTIHEKYQNRLKLLEKLCLAQFATSFETCNAKLKSVKFKDGASIVKGSINQFGSKRRLPKYIKLDDGGTMRLRNSPSVLRIHSSKKKKGNEGI